MREPDPETASGPQAAPRQGRLMRLAWLVIGGVALCLGAIGVVLPLLPTTPFVILAAVAFAKSSPAVHGWLMRSATFGPIIRDWQANGAIALRYKVLALSMMGGAFVLSFAMNMPAVVLGVQALCIAGAAGFILTRPSGAKE